MERVIVVLAGVEHTFGHWSCCSVEMAFAFVDGCWSVALMLTQFVGEVEVDKMEDHSSCSSLLLRYNYREIYYTSL